MRRARALTVAGILVLLVPAVPVGAASEAPSGAEARVLREAQSYLDVEQPEAALQVLTPLTAAGTGSARAFLLLSTAHFMLGNSSEGRAALERSLELDPTQRQAWLNQAALALAEERYDEALVAFETARKLDPTASDNDVNLGATLILKGDVDGARAHFNRYLSEHRSSADAYYLVATNYALAGAWELAVQHLEAAIRLDEKSRLRARTDANFGPLAGYQPFQSLLATDGYRPAEGAHSRTLLFDGPYDGGHGVLLKAVLNALQLSGRPFDRNVEVTAEWALIWADARLKLSNSPAGGGMIEMTAPGAHYTAEEWGERSDELATQVREQLALLALHEP